MERQNMRRILSSRITFGYKFLFPVLWITGFGLGTLALWLGKVKWSATQSNPEFLRWQFLIMWLAGASFIIWLSRRIKHVEIDENDLYVSDYFSDVTIPLTEISRITESRWTSPKTVTIHLRHHTPAGSKIVFLPKHRFAWQISHPIVAELNEIATQARPR